MQVQCVHCGRQYSLRDENAGSQFACRSCGKLSPIAPLEEHAPAASPAQAAAAPTQPESIAIACGHCGKQHRIKPQMAGMQFKCKQCGQISAVMPAPAPPPAAAQPAIAQPPAAATQAQPKRAQAAPRPAASSGGAPLAARPAAPRTALPAAKPATQALAMALPVEPLAAIPLESPSPGSPNVLDLLNESGAPPAASTFGVSPLTARPAPAPPKAPARKKKRKSRWDGAAGESASRIIGGLLCMAAGVGITAFALHLMEGEEFSHRWKRRLLGIGISTVVIGFLVAVGRYNAD